MQAYTAVYLLGPADLGESLDERAWLRARARRMLARRGVASAADLLIANTGEDLRAALICQQPSGPAWLRLGEEAVEAAVEWFAHLYWHHALQEGAATAAGYRFQKSPPARQSMPALPQTAPLFMTQAELPAETAPCLQVHAGHPGEWSVRLRLS